MQLIYQILISFFLIVYTIQIAHFISMIYKTIKENKTIK